MTKLKLLMTLSELLQILKILDGTSHHFEAVNFWIKITGNFALKFDDIFYEFWLPVSWIYFTEHFIQKIYFP